MKDPPSNVPHMKCVKIIHHKGIEKYVENCKWSAWDSRSQKILNAGLSKSIEIAVLYHARLKGLGYRSSMYLQALLLPSHVKNHGLMKF